MLNRKYVFMMIALCMTAVVLVACGGGDEEPQNEEQPEGTTGQGDEEAGEVNIYTSRHYDIDDEIYADFTEETGIEVNIINGAADELIERMNREGEASEADLFYTADAGRLHRAKDQGLLQSIESDIVNENVPENMRDRDSEWVGLTQRARIIAYHKDRVDPEELSTYEALTEPEWEDRVLIRSSENVYNQSLLASFIELHGREEAKDWAQEIHDNLARSPQGGDRDQARAVVAGEGDVAIMNTYYLGGMLNSPDEEEVNVAEQLGIFFPNQETTGTHVNVSGVGLAENAPNPENAVKLIEYLTTEEVQETFAAANYEYPVNPNVEAASTIQEWGEFESQDINLSILGENSAEATRIFNEVGFE
ncbi:Fe(3+) ABC transporter substrate-binding protein [Alkalibacillus haloalkaliphilus]|uniref:Fe(3+) ABC transporter substrate-binding protein n=1 Tax=Alkalibacillus haloalkaliphilus TaxID=94136 RepID=UPI0002DDD44E|nr:Fe(3+) ABC transporter substrate-binding protein [Alkalibacillus haloalkaliphilus]